jgi:hypothetical protein
MRRLVQTTVAVAALALPLALPAGAGARIEWVCFVPGEGDVTFVSAADQARHGITKANSKAGEVFGDKFQEECRVEPPPE